MKYCLLLCLLGWTYLLNAQDVMMQGWYWDYPKPAALPGGGITGANWAQHLNNQAADLGAAGFTHVWLPPLSRASFGAGSNGYDPQDLYDLGEFGQGTTGFGTRTDVDAAIAALNNAGIQSIADVVYNHRDGGAPELNSAVRDYITQHYNASKQPFPSDRYFVRLPLGGASGNGAGDYYFKLSSKTGDPRFNNYTYKIYATTDTRRADPNGAPLTENEPNGGGICGQTSESLPLNTDLLATVENVPNTCGTDEYKITLTAADFDAAGDYLYVYTSNTGGYSDHRFYNIWNATAAADVVGQLEYLTYTDFTGMPSGQGGMNFESFKPNSGNASTQTLSGDWDQLYFFYDYDQSQSSVQTTLFDWSSWLWDDVGIRGYRMDAVKHFDPDFVGGLMNHLHGQGKNPEIVVGEFFDTNPTVLKNWVDDARQTMNAGAVAAIPVRVFDFDLRQALKNASDALGYDVRNVFTSGIVGAAGGTGFDAVTFLNNHDYRHAGEPVQNDPLLGYAYLLTNNQVGLPCVFYPDYAPGTPTSDAFPVTGLKPAIDELIAAQQNYIAGSTEADYLNAAGSTRSATYAYPGGAMGAGANTTLFYQLSGNGAAAGQNVLVAINYAGETLQLTHAIRTDFGGAPVAAGTQFNNVLTNTGNTTTPTLTMNSQGEVYLELPPRSYGVWVQNALLPAELLSFTAETDGSEAQLNWKVGLEENLSHYGIERSADGKVWTAAGRVAARGQSSYTYTDEPATEVAYYRLRMVDFDGSTSYSDVRRVAFERATYAAVRGTSVGEAVEFVFAAPAGQAMQVRMVDANGRVLRQGVFTASDTEERATWSTAGLSGGSYRLQFRTTGGWSRTVGFMAY